MSQRKITKPSLKHNISIQGRSNEVAKLAVKRYKGTKSFKFSYQMEKYEIPQTLDQKMQKQLNQALKLIKPATRVDLRDFKVVRHSRSQALFISMFKAMSKIRTLFMSRHQLVRYLDEKITEIGLKLLPKLQHLTYDFEILVGSNFGTRKPEDYKLKPLRWAQSCSKLRVLNIGKLKFPKGMKMRLKRYPASLESLILKTHLSQRQFDLPKTYPKGLETIDLTFAGDSEAHSHLEMLAKLTKLQELNLQFAVRVFTKSFPVLETISKGNMLRKLKLTFDKSIFNLPLKETFEAFKESQLTHFCLNVSLKSPNFEEIILDFLGRTTTLVSLRLNVAISHSQDGFFENLLSRTQSLQALEHLEIAVENSPKNRKTGRIRNPLYDIFHFPRNLQTLTLKHRVANPPKALEYFFNALRRDEAQPQQLKELKVDFGICHSTRENSKFFPQFFERFLNLEEIEFPSLGLKNRDHSIQVLNHAVNLKALKAFTVGEVAANLEEKVFDRVLILAKETGLRKFSYLASKQANNEDFPQITSKKALKPPLDRLTLLFANKELRKPSQDN